MHLPEIKEWRETGWSLERIAHRLGLAPSSLGRVVKLEMPSSGDRLREMYYSVLGYLRSRERAPQVDPANVPFITHQKYR